MAPDVDLVYRGTQYPGVPSRAFVIEVRGKATSGGAGSSGLFSFDHPVGASTLLLRAQDLGAYPIWSEEGQLVNGRILAFGAGLRVYSQANVWWYAEVGASLLRVNVDVSGALEAGSEVPVGQMLRPVPFAASAWRTVDGPLVDGVLEPRPILAPYADALRLDDNHGIEATWKDNGPTAKAPNAHRIECVVVVAFWLEEGGPGRGLEFPPPGEVP